MITGVGGVVRGALGLVLPPHAHLELGDRPAVVEVVVVEVGLVPLDRDRGFRPFLERRDAGGCVQVGVVGHLTARLDCPTAQDGALGAVANNVVRDVLDRVPLVGLQVGHPHVRPPILVPVANSLDAVARTLARKDAARWFIVAVRRKNMGVRDLCLSFRAGVEIRPLDFKPADLRVVVELRVPYFERQRARPCAPRYELRYRRLAGDVRRGDDLPWRRGRARPGLGGPPAPVAASHVRLDINVVRVPGDEAREGVGEGRNTGGLMCALGGALARRTVPVWVAPQAHHVLGRVGIQRIRHAIRVVVPPPARLVSRPCDRHRARGRGALGGRCRRVGRLDDDRLRPEAEATGLGADDDHVELAGVEVPRVEGRRVAVVCLRLRDAGDLEGVARRCRLCAARRLRAARGVVAHVTRLRGVAVDGVVRCPLRLLVSIRAASCSDGARAADLVDVFDDTTAAIGVWLSPLDEDLAVQDTRGHYRVHPRWAVSGGHARHLW